MSQTHRLCPACRVGYMKPANVPYINQYGETVVSAQKIPAWRCDVCRETEFDEAALQRMELLLGQGLLPPNRYRPASAAAPARKHGPQAQPTPPQQPAQHGPAAGAPGASRSGEAQPPSVSKRAGHRKS